MATVMATVMRKKRINKILKNNGGDEFVGK